MKRVIHLMKGFSSKEGVLNVPARISCVFKRDIKDIDVLVLVTKEIGNLSAISEPASKFLPEIRQSSGVFMMLRNIREFRPDVLIIHQYFGKPTLLFLQIICKTMRVKNIIGLDLVRHSTPTLKQARLADLVRNIAKYALDVIELYLADGLFCRSENEINLLSFFKIPRKKFYIIPVPLGYDYEIGTSFKKKNYLLAVSGWLGYRKNLFSAIKVFFKVLEKTNFSYKFIIVGQFFKGKYRMLNEEGYYLNKWETGEEYEEKMMSFIKKHNLENHIEFVGIKKGEELQDLYREAKIYYLPSKCEGFPTTLIEAMASGTPIVAMKNSSVQYIVEDGETGFLRNTEEGQKEVILKLLQDKELYDVVQKNCLKEAQKYKWENVAKVWVRVVNNI